MRQSNSIDEVVPFGQQFLGPSPHQFGLHLRHALVKLSQLYLMLFFVLERLLHHLQLIQILDDLSIVGLSVLVLQPKRLEVFAVVLADVLEDLLEGLRLSLEFLLLAESRMTYLTLQ